MSDENKIVNQNITKGVTYRTWTAIKIMTVKGYVNGKRVEEIIKGVRNGGLLSITDFELITEETGKYHTVTTWLCI